LLNITIENARDVMTVRCYGRLVYVRESALFCAAVTQGGREMIVDLRGVSFNRHLGNRRPGIASSDWYSCEAVIPFRDWTPGIQAYTSS
jgi:hypothetical protein